MAARPRREPLARFEPLCYPVPTGQKALRREVVEPLTGLTPAERDSCDPPA